MRTMKPVCFTTKLSFPESIWQFLGLRPPAISTIQNKNTDKKYVWINILNGVLFSKYKLNILIDITSEMIL